MSSSNPQSQPQSASIALDAIPPNHVSDSESEATSSAGMASLRQHPIPPPSEPMQYRAIGLVRGRYASTEEQFTQGTLTTPDGTVIDAVLLGRVMSLVKKHLDLNQEHLWVVYPRTRDKDEDLHTQIVGVWEPENLTPESEPTAITATEEPQLSDGYFSIRGEVVYYSAENTQVVVKIKQAPRKQDDRPKSFKLALTGTLEGRTLGHFWDFHVERQGHDLVIRQGTVVAALPPKRKPKFDKRGPRKPFGRRPTGNRPIAERPAGTVPPPVRREPLPKPIKNPPQQS